MTFSVVIAAYHGEHRPAVIESFLPNLVRTSMGAQSTTARQTTRGSCRVPLP